MDFSFVIDLLFLFVPLNVNLHLFQMVSRPKPILKVDGVSETSTNTQITGMRMMMVRTGS